MELVKLTNLVRSEKSPNFEKKIDLFSIEEGAIIGVTGALGFGYRLIGRDILLEPEWAIEHFEKELTKFLNALPDGVTLHFVIRQGIGDENALQAFEAAQKAKDEVSLALREDKIRFLRQNPFLKREIFLFVQIDSEYSRKKSFLLPDVTLIRTKHARRLRENEYTEKLEALGKLESYIKEELHEMGIGLEKLNDEAITKYIFDVLNPSSSSGSGEMPYCVKPRRTRCEEEESLRSRLLLARPGVFLDHFYLDGYFHKAVVLRALPETSNIKQLKDFLGALGSEYYVSIRLEAPDQDQEKALIRRKSNFHKVEALFSRSTRHEAGVRHEESEELERDLAEGKEKLFYLSLAAIVKGESLKEVSEKADHALRTFPKLGNGVGLIDDMNHDRHFLSLLPLQGTENPLQYLVKSSVAAHFLPLQAEWPGSKYAGSLFKTYSGHALQLDLFDPSLEAKHALMAGSTGAGKSFFTNQLILSFLSQSPDHDVVVIDAGGSFRKLARVLGGEYLEVECDEQFAVNPFPAKQTLFPGAGKTPDPSYLQFLKELLERMVSPQKKFSGSQKMILEKAILESYELLKDLEAPLLENVEAILKHYVSGDEEDQKAAYQMAKELSPYTKGEFSRVLNRHSHFDLSSRFVVFDIRKISKYPELQSIFLLIIPFALRQKFENIERKKLFVLDECWQLLKEVEGSDLVEIFYRTARKFNGAVLSITQNAGDFLSSDISEVLINLSRVKYILRLEEGFESLGRFGLNENEIAAAREIEVVPGSYAEVFVKFGGPAVLLRYQPSPLEYWISTTDPLDRTEEEHLKKVIKEGTELDLLSELAHEFPHGVTRGKEKLRAA